MKAADPISEVYFIPCCRKKERRLTLRRVAAEMMIMMEVTMHMTLKMKTPRPPARSNLDKKKGSKPRQINYVDNL